ncbi:hypothetical protein L1049_000900 [Liquidambar formosana]|uniref:Uncharacterized protein n=1 Tax=Liquidambar formosana TaxID=63359 RepID=A0AAP0R812_LIQFO
MPSLTSPAMTLLAAVRASPPTKIRHSASLMESPLRALSLALSGGSSNNDSSRNAVTRRSRRVKIPFLTFLKLSFFVPEPKDFLLCGGLEFYDRTYDCVTPKNEWRLEKFKN